MNTMDKRLQDLMVEWKESHIKHGYTSFISDGLVNAEEYKKSSPKICFFLKEAYSKEKNDGWSLTEWLNAGAMTRMWGSVAEWTYGIQNTTKDSIAIKPQLSDTEKTDILKKIGIINVKKSNGNSQSSYEDLKKFAQGDLQFLKAELDIINPNIIVCGNNSSLLRLLYGASVQPNGKISSDGLIDLSFLSKNGFGYVEDKIIIDYYHPANQYPSKLNYYTVCALYQQALKHKG